MKNPANSRIGTALAKMTPGERRELIAERLRILADMVGGATQLAQIAGVNRTQFSRYLNAKSTPRPELLFDVATHFGLSVDWFFVPDTSLEVLLPTVAAAERFQELVSGRQIGLQPGLMKEGFYRFWKGMFADSGVSGEYEYHLSRLTIQHNVGYMRTLEYVPRSFVPLKYEIDDFSCTCEALVLNSAKGAVLLFVEDFMAYFGTGYLESVVPNYFVGLPCRLAGELRFMRPEEANRKQVVPMFLEQIEGSLSELKAIAYSSKQTLVRKDVPDYVLGHLDSVGVPGFAPAQSRD